MKILKTCSFGNHGRSLLVDVLRFSQPGNSVWTDSVVEDGRREENEVRILRDISAGGCVEQQKDDQDLFWP